MIWGVYIAVILALGVTVMMRHEIMHGYYRWRDYLVAIPLLYGAAMVLLVIDGFLASISHHYWFVVLPLRGLLTFAAMVVVWGGTLALSALLARLVFPQTGMRS